MTDKYAELVRRLRNNCFAGGNCDYDVNGLCCDRCEAAAAIAELQAQVQEMAEQRRELLEGGID